MKIGSGWNRTKQADGAPYLSLAIEHPQLNDGRPLNPVLVESTRTPGTFLMVWERSDAAKGDPIPVRGGTGAPDGDAPAPALGGRRRRG